MVLLDNEERAVRTLYASGYYPRYIARILNAEIKVGLRERKGISGRFSVQEVAFYTKTLKNNPLIKERRKQKREQLRAVYGGRIPSQNMRYKGYVYAITNEDSILATIREEGS